MSDAGLKMRLHFESAEALECFLSEAETLFPDAKILGRGGTPGQGLNCMWLDLLLPTKPPAAKPSLDSKIQAAKKTEPRRAKPFFWRSRTPKGKNSI